MLHLVVNMCMSSPHLIFLFYIHDIFICPTYRLPLIYAQKAVFYKHTASLLYPPSCFVLAQAIVLWPLHLIESVIFTTIM